MKILYAASTYSHLKSFHIPYIEALRAEGHTVLTMARGCEADFDIPFEKRMLSGKNRVARGMIKQIVKEEGFDLIILNTSLAAFHIRLALNKKDRPRVLNIVHGYLFPKRAQGIRRRIKRLILLMAERILKNKTDAVLTMNKEDYFIALEKRLARESVGICHGMGVKERSTSYTRRAAKELLGAADRSILLFVGELSARKNQEFLIKAMPKILALLPSAQLWLIGEGDEREKLSLLIESLGIQDAVKLFGRQENIGDYIAAADLYVSAARSEGLPFNVVEAMLGGLPVLLSDVKGHRDILCGDESVGSTSLIDGTGLVMSRDRSEPAIASGGLGEDEIVGLNMLFAEGDSDSFARCAAIAAAGNVKGDLSPCIQFTFGCAFKGTYGLIKKLGKID